jgi:MOSC domain-containing protein YiiM
MGTLINIFVGLPKTYGSENATDPLERPWRTAIFKQPVLGKVHLGKLGLEGDGVANTHYHGGEQQAVLAYSADRFPRWQKEFNHPGFAPGCFGENLSVTGQDEDSVCIGDTFRIGGAIVQVSQPRQPCGTLARRNRHKALVEEVIQTGWSGWYLRVLQEGAVRADDPIELLEHPYPQWNVALVGRIRNFLKDHREEARELSNCPLLSPEWRGIMAR